MGWFEHTGSRVYYEESGSGVPVLLLPGWGGTIDELAPLWEALSPNFRVIAADLPGSGKSEPQPRTYTPSYFHDDAPVFLAMLEFVLLVPATHGERLLTWTDGESHEIARRAADAARDLLSAAGVRVTAAHVGDPSPLQAIDDELRDDPAYDGLIISTLPASTSRWLRMGVCKQAERRFGKRVIAVTAEPTHPIA